MDSPCFLNFSIPQFPNLLISQQEAAAEAVAAGRLLQSLMPVFFPSLLNIIYIFLYIYKNIYRTSKPLEVESDGDINSVKKSLILHVACIYTCINTYKTVIVVMVVVDGEWWLSCIYEL